MPSTIFEVLLMLSSFMPMTHGHGRLLQPPGRSSLWRFGYNTPSNRMDHQLSCGGFGVQYYVNEGRCGICGDPYNGDRENEAGGKYAKEIIAGEYQQGDAIVARVDITVNHGGWFEFRICPNNDFKKRATQECLDKYLLRLTDGSTRYQMQMQDGTGIFNIILILPEDVTCTQCVFQWKWNTASNFYCEGSECCRGCGPQEQFYGCADIKINPKNNIGSSNQPYVVQTVSHTPITLQGPVSDAGKFDHFPDSYIPIAADESIGSEDIKEQENIFGQLPARFLSTDLQPSQNNLLQVLLVHAENKSCMATHAFKTIRQEADVWCEQACASGNCPKDKCLCRVCTAKRSWQADYRDPLLADNWCRQRCFSGFCPLEFCETSCLYNI